MLDKINRFHLIEILKENINHIVDLVCIESMETNQKFNDILVFYYLNKNEILFIYLPQHNTLIYITMKWISNVPSETDRIQIIRG